METSTRNDVTGRGPAGEAEAAWIALDLARARGRTLALLDLVPEEALGRHVRSFLSPLAWDIGHLARFERLWLVDAVEGRTGARLDEDYDALDTPRQERGSLSLPGKRELRAQMSTVREEVLALLADLDPATRDPLLRDGYVYRMVMQHEAQHQETMLQALDIPEEGWGWGAAVTPTGALAGTAVTPADERGRVAIAGGVFSMGTDDRTRAYDNERGRHEVEVRAFEMERYPVTNRRWVDFIDDEGYRRAELWSAGGRAWLEESAPEHPQGWIAGADGWRLRRFGGERRLDLAEPVQHVSYWEAEAFARWRGGRLPSEAEWEKAAAWGPSSESPRTYPWGETPPRRFPWSDPPPAPEVEGDEHEATTPPRKWGPPPVGARPEAASAWGVHDMLGSVYQWTSSRFEAYPGFEPFPYREYSSVFFGDEYAVLRGSSWAAAPILWRNTYRNWDLRRRRQIFAGVRVVYDD